MAHTNTNTFLVAQLSGLRVRTLINRGACEHDFVRKAHDRLVVVLDEMIADLSQIIKAEHDHSNACRNGGGEDEGFDLAYYRERFAENWQEQPIALLDDAYIDRATGEYFDRPAGRWFVCDGTLPIIVPVGPDMLCGLRAIIAEIENASGTSFTIEHVYYSEIDAEAAFYASQASGLDSA